VGDDLGTAVLIECEGFDAVDVEDMMGLVLAAMTVPELSKRKRNKANDDNALLSVNSCSGTGLASFSASSHSGLVVVTDVI
jgi:hypothetical protein